MIDVFFVLFFYDMKKETDIPHYINMNTPTINGTRWHRLLVLVPGRRQVRFHCGSPKNSTTQCRKATILLASPFHNTETTETTTTTLPSTQLTTSYTSTPTTTPNTTPHKCSSPTTHPTSPLPLSPLQLSPSSTPSPSLTTKKTTTNKPKANTVTKPSIKHMNTLNLIVYTPWSCFLVP